MLAHIATLGIYLKTGGAVQILNSLFFFFLSFFLSLSATDVPGISIFSIFFSPHFNLCAHLHPLSSFYNLVVEVTHILGHPWDSSCPTGLWRTGCLLPPCSASCCRRSRSAGGDGSYRSLPPGPGTSWRSSLCCRARSWAANVTWGIAEENQKKEREGEKKELLSSHRHAHPRLFLVK